MGITGSQWASSDLHTIWSNLFYKNIEGMAGVTSVENKTLNKNFTNTFIQLLDGSIVTYTLIQSLDGWKHCYKYTNSMNIL